ENVGELAKPTDTEPVEPTDTEPVESTDTEPVESTDTEPVESTDTEPVEVEFFVKDTGLGIPKNRQQAIFDRFVQADIEDKAAYEGSGLGLSISKAYVEMLGGEIWVESEEGIGSQFFFTIPYDIGKKDVAESKLTKSEAITEQQLKKLKILIAEDDKSADIHLSILTKKISKEILHTKTGTETVDVCRNNPDIDLVLMDIRMPEMDGYEATRKIREFNKDIVIIAQTAYALAGNREEAIEAGCNDYVSKPIKQEVLMAKIVKWLSG
ncbi:MAG: response regulator, partial [Bacteroidales bacterium]|nr:response regulator [Bacteroidales bacterium]